MPCCFLLPGSVARVSTSGAAAGKIPLPAFLEDDDQSTEGGMLLLMMVGDQNLGLIRRAMDQQVKAKTCTSIYTS